jgi:hypothetical protein
VLLARGYISILRQHGVSKDAAMWRLFLAMCLLVGPASGWAAAPVAVATILDGDSPRVVREAARLSLAEGVRLMADDIIETSERTRLLRIEFNDGTILDVGPATRLLLSPRFSGAKRAARFYLMNGFAKLTAAKGAPANSATFASPAFDVTGLSRDVVVLVAPQEAYAFAESGDVSLVERGANGKEAAAFKLKNGDFFMRAGDAKAVVVPRPVPTFVKRLPRAFIDTLPARAELYKTREVDPKPEGGIVYADVQPWIDAEAGLRPGFVTRWRAQARNPEFRKGLVAGISAHPEWDRTLFPEKYLPKPPPSSPMTTGSVLSAPAKPYR